MLYYSIIQRKFQPISIKNHIFPENTIFNTALISPFCFKYIKGLLFCAFSSTLFDLPRQREDGSPEKLQHNKDYVATADILGGFLYYKVHTFHTTTVLVTACNYVNSGGINA